MEKTQKRKTEHVSYGLIRARRKTMALKVSGDGTVTVRIPYGVRPEEADRFVEAHVDWIRKRIAECRERAAARPAYTDREREAGKRLAKELLLKKCRYFAERMGVSYGGGKSLIYAGSGGRRAGCPVSGGADGRPGFCRRRGGVRGVGAPGGVGRAGV